MVVRVLALPLGQIRAQIPKPAKTKIVVSISGLFGFAISLYARSQHPRYFRGWVPTNGIASYNRFQIRISHRLDYSPVFVEHLNLAAAGSGAFHRVFEGVLATCFAAVHRLYAFSFEDFPTTWFLPPRVTRQPDLNDPRVHVV